MIKQLICSYPVRAALIALIFTILIGFSILLLPCCHNQNIPANISAIDIFYTAASAACTCGSLTIPINSFSNIGKAIIILLVQIGGLGLITLTLIAIAFFVEFGIGVQFMAGHLLEVNSMKEVRPILKFIIKFTLISEFLGMIFFLPFFLKDNSFLEAFWQSLFHTISAFCNTGIVLSKNVSLLLQNDYLFLFATFVLTFLGGVGFLVWFDVVKVIKSKLEDRRISLSLYSKVVFTAIFYLWLASGSLIFILERNRAFINLGFFKSFIYAFFTAFSMKSTGFLLVPINFFSIPVLLIIMVLAFVGSGPGSAGSGIKITTAALALVTIRAVLFNTKSVEIKSRTIAEDQIFKAFSIIILSSLWLFVTVFILTLTESGSFLELLIESVSAFSSLGISLKDVSTFTSFGKLLLCCNMIAGRVGILSLIIAFTKNRKIKEYSYPTERLLLN